MTAPYRRTDAIDVSGDHQRRINVLEALPQGIAQFDIKVIADGDVFGTGDGQFIFAIPSDLNGTSLTSANAYVTTVGSSVTTVQIRNATTGPDMLSTPITIDASEFTSYTAAPSVPNLNPTFVQVATGDLIAIDVDNAGSAAMGLGVILDFN